MPQCMNCDSHVTNWFARVFGDNDDTVYRCPGCASTAELDGTHKPPGTVDESNQQV